MTEFLSNLFANIFGDNVVLAVILIAMVPIIELRGAIPFATNPGFWGEIAMNNWQAFGWSLLGSSAVVFVVALIFIPVINWLKKIKIFKKLALAIENRVKDKSQKIEGADEKSAKFSRPWWKKVLAVFAFVAIPLPFTGVWTGTCLAVFVGLDYVSTCSTVLLGNLLAGLIITLMLQFFPWLNSYLFYIFIVLILVIVLIELIKFIIKRKNNNKNQAQP